VIWSAESELLGALMEEFVEVSRSIPESLLKGEEAAEGLPFSSVDVPGAPCAFADGGIVWPLAGVETISESAAMQAAEKQAIRDRRAP
jgi:hypothetical protein